MFAKKRKENFLNFVPMLNPEFEFSAENGIVVVKMLNKGFFNYIAQKFFKRPRISKIKLDELGSAVYLKIDGVRTVEKIADEVLHDYKGSKAISLEQIVSFLGILKHNKFVEFDKKI
ncbi:MAG: PqqD family protein [Clostridioides sp.]|jgi:hypothetical protein|nr:PqqD family protein [Clostridioides sp.]